MLNKITFSLLSIAAVVCADIPLSLLFTEFIILFLRTATLDSKKCILLTKSSRNASDFYILIIFYRHHYGFFTIGTISVDTKLTFHEIKVLCHKIYAFCTIPHTTALTLVTGYHQIGNVISCNEIYYQGHSEQNTNLCHQTTDMVHTCCLRGLSAGFTYSALPLAMDLGSVELPIPVDLFAPLVLVQKKALPAFEYEFSLGDVNEKYCDSRYKI